MDTYTHTPSEYNRQGFVYDIPQAAQGARRSRTRRTRGTSAPSSAAPEHEHKEAHTRIGEGLVPLKLPGGEPTSGPRSTDQPIPVTRFLKD